MRKSVLACTVSFLMSPIASWALGMGDIQVNSSLNQPLNAEIALHSVTKKDLDSLHIEMASKKIYARADIERSYYLSKFRFKLIERNGKHYVSVTTKEPFREPFANFLVEVSWSSGRLLREYTMLMDPPEFIKKHVRPVKTASTARSSQVKRTPIKQSTRQPVSSSQSSNYVLTPSGEISYGPTKRNDTLWHIAKSIAPENVTIDQMMIALLRDNPEAFVNNNINNLKSGYVLRIKDKQSLNKLSRSNATRQVRDQYQSWKETRQQKPVANLVDRSDRSSAEAPSDGQLTLVASGDKDSADMKGDLSSKSENLKEKLSLAGEELESKQVENQELRARIKELEELLKTKTSLVELKDESLAALQKQKEMQTMESPEDASTEIMPVDSPAPADEIVTTETEVLETDVYKETEMLLAEHIDPSVELSKDEQMSLESEAPVNVDEVISIPEITQSETITEVAEVTEAEPISPEPMVKEAAKPKPASAPKPKSLIPPTGTVLDVLLNEKMLPYTAGSGVLLLGLLAWLGLRGRGKKENEFEESILDSKLEGDDSEFNIEDSQLVNSSASSTEVLASDTETSFLSDFSADDMESLQPDDTEADPISEADVFMVYGRYQQAEELLQSAIKSEPERLDFQLKLLEVYHGDNLKDSFAVQADVVKGLLKKDNDDFELTTEWVKAKSWAEKLGINIDMPDMFDEDGPVSEDSMTDEIQSLDDELSLDSEEINLNEDSILGDITDSDVGSDLALEEDTSEFSLDDSILEDDTGSSHVSDDDFELSLDDFETSDDSQESDKASDLDESILNLDDSLELEDGGFELEDDSLELENDSLELEDDSLELEDDSLELENDSLELEDDSLELENDSLELENDSLELENDSLELDDSLELGDLGELSLDEDEDKDSDVDNSLATEDESDELDLLDDDLDFDELEDDFPELDAVGTKLDLAKAYIDMGDMESASSILNEVIDEGDEEQKSQAQSLLDQTES